MIWRWRWELAALVGVTPTLWVLWVGTGAWLLVIVPVVVSGIALTPPCHALMARRIQAVVVQHRLRTGFASAGVHGPKGELPAILWTRVVPAGERTYLWCPPAVTIEDVRSERRRLAEACRARSVRVHRQRRFPRIVVLDVVRRGRDEADRLSAALRSVPRPRPEQQLV